MSFDRCQELPAKGALLAFMPLYQQVLVQGLELRKKGYNSTFCDNGLLSGKKCLLLLSIKPCTKMNAGAYLLAADFALAAFAATAALHSSLWYFQ